MKNDKSVEINQNPNWPYMSNHPYMIVIIGGSGSQKANRLLNLINEQPTTDKMYLYVKEPFKSKYQLLINKKAGIN